MITLIAFVLTLIPGPGRGAHATTPTAAGYNPVNTSCWCQTIPLKDWRK